MPRTLQPRKTWRYSTEFKVRAVKLTMQEGIKVKQVAEGLDIHPFMLSRWRKEYRDGKLQGDSGGRVTKEPKTRSPSVKAMKENEQLQKEVRRLEKENDLLKKWQRYLAEAHQNDLASSKGTGRS